MPSVADFVRSAVPVLYGAAAAYPYDASLAKKYRFTSRYDDEVSLHRLDEENKLIWLPRALCPVPQAGDKRVQVPAQFDKGPTPRPNQVKVFAETAAFLSGGLSGQVQAPTGWGKTVLGYHAAWLLQQKTLVVTTKDDIYSQWLAGAPKFLGISPEEVGEIRQDKCEVKDRKFVVAMIHSLSKDHKYPPSIREQFGLVIYDECHRLPAEQFQKVAWMFPSYWRLGLTATPDRADGKEVVVQAHIGPIRSRAPEKELIPKVLLVDTGWECPMVRRRHNGEVKVVRVPHEHGKTIVVEKMMAADPVRNQVIVQALVDAHAKGRHVVAFSTLLDHLHTLHRALIDAGVPGKDIGHYGQAATKAEREARDKITVRPILLTTYGMMAEGTDLPWLDTCLFAMPRANVRQAGGRIRREYEDKKFPAFIDMVDDDSPVFRDYAGARRKWYESIGCEIVEIS